MITIPFIYFTLFFIYVIKKRTLLSMSSILILVYVVASFFTILLDYFNAYDSGCPKIEIRFIPTVLYCVLLTLTILPFYRINETKITKIRPLKNPKILDCVVHVYFVIFLLMLLLLTPDIIRNWTLSQINPNLKAEFWDKETSFISLSGPLLWVANRCMNFASASLFIIPLFFYNINFRKKKRLFYIETILGSCTIIISSVLTQDRSRIIFWFMMFVLCYAFYYKFMGHAIKKKINISIVVLASLLVFYVVMMNIKRYTDNNNFDNTNLFLLNYAGQSFINFCNFYENLNLPLYNFEGAFPFISHYLDGSAMNTREWASYVAVRSNINILVFSTFIGFLMSYMGFFLTVIWCIVFYYLCTKKMPRNVREIDYYQFNLIFTFIHIPYLGVFAYIYHSFVLEFFVFVFLFLTYKASK